MAFAATVLLVASIVLHELSHSLVARRCGLPIKGITLFIFGGVAEMEDEPASPRVEFMMAIAGPLASVILAGVFYVIRIAFPWNVPTSAVLAYFVWINGVLAAFNLLPAFPLDGDRLLRSVLWAWKKDPVTVPPGTSILSFVEDYVYSHHFKLFPVVDSDRLVGCVTTRDVKNTPREKWNSTTVGDIARECNGSNSIAPDTSVLEALAVMNRERVGRLVVVDHNQLAGVITLRDLGEYLSFKLDLESDIGTHRGAA